MSNIYNTMLFAWLLVLITQSIYNHKKPPKAEFTWKWNMVYMPEWNHNTIQINLVSETNIRLSLVLHFKNNDSERYHAIAFLITVDMNMMRLQGLQWPISQSSRLSDYGGQSVLLFLDLSIEINQLTSLDNNN